MSKRFRLLAGIATLIPAFALLAQDLPANPKPNPYLAAEKYAITHFDSSQSDSFPYAVPRGTFEVDLRKEKRIVAGPVNIMTLASTSPSYMWGVSSEGVTYIDVSNGGFKEVARMEAPDGVVA